MANFAPLKGYMLFCLDRFIERYGVQGPFLEVGCGRGDVAAHLAAKGWRGTAIDFSDDAVAHAARALKGHSGVTVARQALAEVTGTFRCVILWDVLEHIEDDDGALRTIAQRLDAGGHVLIAVPSNPHEWRWDDELYGHWRRYTVDGLRAQLAAAGLPALAFWDFTFPVFWAMRRAYTRMKSPPALPVDREAATKASTSVNAWDVPGLSRWLDRTAPLWLPVHHATFRLFRHAPHRGHEFFALAQKPAAG